MASHELRTPLTALDGYLQLLLRQAGGTAKKGATRQYAELALDQARRCFEIIAGALADAGASVENVVRTRMYIVDAADAGAVGQAHGEVLGGIRPVATMVVVAGLLDARWRVEIEAEAVIPPGG